MSLGLNHLLPNLAHSLDGVGFLFGAGASFEAGYPLMGTLTSAVVSRLGASERACLDSVLNAVGRNYDDAKSLPNIEELSDLMIAHSINSGDAAASALEERFRELIVDEMLGVSALCLDHHVKFFQRLKARSFGLPCTVWIFTTNYDVLLETSAALAEVDIETGFTGTTTRFFDPAQFVRTKGTLRDGRFIPHSGLTVKLVKLHGSLSWASTGGSILEQHPDSLSKTHLRTMVLPRRRKVMDTLAAPYDQLFALASRALGSDCRYLISCGFSFADDHINQTLLMPVLGSGKCRLSALCDQQPDGLNEIVKLPSAMAAFSTHSIDGAASSTEGTDLWKFSKFAEAF